MGVTLIDLTYTIKMLLLISLLLGCMLSFTNGCIGNGCVHDKMENQFYWISARETEMQNSVVDIGGPFSYRQTLGLAKTPKGSSLWMRALELEKTKWGSNSMMDNEDVICHEPKWN